MPKKKPFILPGNTKIYIDGANMFYAQKALKWHIDWKRFYDYLHRSFTITNIRYYTGVKNDDPKMDSFLRYLNAIGIQTSTKPLKKIKTHGGHTYKSNFDVEMTMDIVFDIDSYDLIILVSGDSDFYALTKKLHSQNKKVVVISSRKMLSWELKLSVDQYIFIEDLRSEIERE